jgi:hypothetical protein
MTVHKPKELKFVDDPSFLPLLIFDNIEKKWGILKTINSVFYLLKIVDTMTVVFFVLPIEQILAVYFV